MRIKTPKDVGYYIASTRKALRWSQSDLAIKIGKDQRFVSKLENAPATVAFSSVLVVLNVLSIDIDLHSLITTNSQSPHKLAKSGDLFSPSKKKPAIISKPNIGKK